MPQKLLVVGPSWIGDMIMAQSLFMALKSRYEDCVIHVLAPTWTFPLLARMPEVSKSIEMPVGHGSLQWSVRKNIGLNLRQENYDQAIVLPNSLKSALVPWMSKIPKRTGWRGEMRFGLLNDIRTLDKRRYPLMIERFIALAFTKGKTLPRQLPWPKLYPQQNSVKHAMQQHNLNNTKPILILCPGAEYGPAKRWPPSHYAQVANWFIEQNGQVWIMGSKNDQAQAEAILGEAPNAIDLCGHTSLAEAIDLMSLAAAVVTNDSGLMHIAAALARPIVAIYGSSSPQFTPPLTKHVEVKSLNLACSPCFKRECPLGHTNCLVTLPAQPIIDAVETLLQSSI